MARKARKIQDPSSEDEAPEVVSHSTSKADAKRDRKTLHDFEAEERTRRKARNRERDQKLKERARVTKGGKTGEELSKSVRFKDQAEEGDDGEESSEDGGGDVEARMLKAMRDAAGEVESEGEEDDEDSEFKVDSDDDMMASGSGSSFAQDEDDSDKGHTPLQADTIGRRSRRVDYLADDLFAAAFASRSSKGAPKKGPEATPQETVKKRRRKSTKHAKDLVIGGRTIRTLPRLSDPRSQATARTVPSARARRFVDQSLAMKGKRALAKAKKKGWERRPANVGVMKCQGAPHGFVRSTR